MPKSYELPYQGVKGEENYNTQPFPQDKPSRKYIFETAIQDIIFFYPYR